MTAEDIQKWLKRLPSRRLAFIAATMVIILIGVATIQMIRAARGFSHTIEVIELLEVYCEQKKDWPKSWDALGCGDLSGYVTIDFAIAKDDVVKNPEILKTAVIPLFGSIDNMPEQEEILVEIGLKLQYDLKLKVIQDRLTKEGREVSETEALEIGKLYCDLKQWGWFAPSATRSGDVWIVSNTDEKGASTIRVDAKTGNVQ